MQRCREAGEQENTEKNREGKKKGKAKKEHEKAEKEEKKKRMEKQRKKTWKNGYIFSIFVAGWFSGLEDPPQHHTKDRWHRFIESFSNLIISYIYIYIYTETIRKTIALLTSLLDIVDFDVTAMLFSVFFHQ